MASLLRLGFKEEEGGKGGGEGGVVYSSSSSFCCCCCSGGRKEGWMGDEGCAVSIKRRREGGRARTGGGQVMGIEMLHSPRGAHGSREGEEEEGERRV